MTSKRSCDVSALLKETSIAERSLSTAEEVSPRSARCLRSARMDGSDFCKQVRQGTPEQGLSYLVQPVSECIFSAWCSAEHSPIVYYKLVTTWSSLSFWHGLHSTDSLDGRFEVQSKGIVRLGLSRCYHDESANGVTTVLTTRPEKIHCKYPVPSRRTMNMIPFWSRSLCTHPETRTRSPRSGRSLPIFACRGLVSRGILV